MFLLSVSLAECEGWTFGVQAVAQRSQNYLVMSRGQHKTHIVSPLLIFTGEEYLLNKVDDEESN
jgi:hypothetical protein